MSLCNPPPWSLCIPGKPKQMPSCHPSNFQIPESQGHRIVPSGRDTERSLNPTMLNMEDLGVEKQLLPKGSAKSMGEGGRFEDIKNEIQ